ncbi:MAG: PHP domain-containing protein, partial [Bacteroidota bacterium]|nr:PHP domain-containing protein [Bacteroidota bacterium]
MKTFNLHTHTCHSDGSQEPRKYIEEALKQDFEVLGFSDHSPLPFQNNFAIKNDGPALQEYCHSILSLKKEFAPESNASGKLNIFLGLELEYVPGITHPISFYREKFPFDYIIGSVHLVKNEWNELWFIDGPKKEIYDEGLKTLFGN